MDYIADIALQEIALEGQVGVNQRVLWDLVGKRVGGYIHKEEVRKALWERLCLLDGEQIVVHKKEVANGLVTWPRVRYPKGIPWEEAITDSYIIKASVKLRVRAFGMDIGNAGDPAASAELKMQAFRILQVIGATRLDGIKQALLAQRVGLDSPSCSLLLTYSESRNLIAKYNAHNGKMVHIRRLTERRAWPLFYNGLDFIAGATSSLKRTQAIKLLQQATPSLLASMLAKGGMVPMARVINSITNTVLKDMPGVVNIIGGPRIRSLLKYQIIGIIAPRKDYVIQRNVTNHLDIVPASEADPELILKGTMQDEDDDDTTNTESLYLTLAPWKPFMVQFFQNVVDSSPVGYLKSAIIMKNGKMTENLIPEIISLPGVESSTTNLGKLHHQLIYTRSDFTNALHCQKNGYSTSQDPTLFPSKHIPEAPVSDNAKKGLAQTVALSGQGTASRQPDRKYFLGGTYKSWAPGIGSCAQPGAQWKPDKPPLSQEASVTLTKTIEDSKAAMNKRIAYWAGQNNTAGVKGVQEKIEAEGVKMDSSLGNLTTRYLKAAVLDLLLEKKIIGWHSAREIVKEVKLFKRIMTMHEKDNNCERRVCTLQVLASKKEIEFWCIVGLDQDSQVVKDFFEELNNYHMKFVTVQPQSKHSSDDFVREVVKNIRVPEDCKKDEKLKLLYQLSTLPTIRVDKIREERQDKQKVLYEVKRYVHTFWVIKNGFITSKMMCIQKLHSYLRSLSEMTAFTVKDLIDGMTLTRFGKLVGIPFNVADLIEVDSDTWSKPLCMQPEKLTDFIYQQGKGGTLLKGLKGFLGIMLHLGLLKRVKDKPTHFYQDEYKLTTSATLKKVVVTEEMEMLLRVKFDYDFTEGETAVTAYWETLRAVLCDPTVETKDLDLSVLGNSTRAQYTWDGGLPIMQITERRMNEFKGDRPPESFTTVDAYKLMMLTNLNYAQAVSCLTGNIQLLRTSVKTVHRIAGAIAAKRKGKRKKKDGDEKDKPAKKVKRAKKVKEDTTVDPDDSEDDRKSDADSGDEHAEVAKRPKWATADQLVKLLETVILHGGNNQAAKASSIISWKGLFLLKTNHTADVAKELGWTEQKLKARWRYIAKKPELKLLSQYAMLVRAYNVHCGFELNDALGTFMTESYNPCFKQGHKLPTRLSDFHSQFDIIRTHQSDQRFHPYKKISKRRPRLVAAMEALKLLNMCPESTYDLLVAQSLMEGFCDAPDQSCLQEALEAMTNASGGNLLSKVRRAPGTRGRHFQLTQISEECLLPRNLGLAHYQEAWGIADAVEGKKAFTPHAVLSGGQLAYIVDEVAAGSLSLSPQEYAGIEEDPLRSQGFRRATVAKLMNAFFKTATRAQKVYYIENGIMCIPVDKKEMPIVAEAERDVEKPEVHFGANYIELWKLIDEPVQQVKRPLVRTAYEAFGDRYFSPDNHGYIVSQAEHSSTAEAFNALENNESYEVEGDTPMHEEEATQDEHTQEEEREGSPKDSEAEEEVAVVQNAIPRLVSYVQESWLDKAWNIPEGAPGAALTQLLGSPDVLRMFIPYHDDVNPEFLKAACSIVYKAIRIAGEGGDGVVTSKFKDILLQPLRVAAPEAPEELVGEASSALVLPVSNILSSMRCVVRLPRTDGDDLHLTLALGSSCLYPVQKLIALKARNEYAANTIKPAGVMRVAALVVAAVAQVEVHGAVFGSIVAAAVAVVHLGCKLDDLAGGSVTVLEKGGSHLGSKAKEIVKGNVLDGSTSEKKKNAAKKNVYRKDYATLGGADDGLESVARPLSALISMHGTVNKPVVNRVMLALYDYLTTYPGSCVDSIIAAFPFFTAATITDVLTTMECEAVVRSAACPVATEVSPASLFSDPQYVKCTKCYYAVPGAMRRLHRVGDYTRVE